MGVYDGVYKLDTTQAADQNWSALHKEMGKNDRTASVQFRCNQSCQSQEGLLFGSYFLEALERLKNRIDSMHLNWKSLELKSNLPGIPEADSKAWMAPGGNVHTMTVMENKDGSFTTSTNNTSTPQFNSSFTSKVSLRMKTYLLFILEPKLFMK